MNSVIFERLLNNTVVPANIPYEEQLKRYEPIVSYVNAHLPEQLYRFRRCNDNNLEAFLNDQIWVSAAKNMNDGFDARIYFDRDVVRSVFSQNTKSVRNLIETYLSSKDASVFSKELTKAALFRELLSVMPDNIASITDITDLVDPFAFPEFADPADTDGTKAATRAVSSVLLKEVEKILEGLSPVSQEVLKFACFSEKLYSPLMWGLYAGDESGYAVAYHFDRMSFTAPLSGGINRSFSLFPIMYSDKRFEISFEYVRFLAEQSMLSKSLERLHDSQMRQIGRTLLEQHAKNSPDTFL